MEGKAKGGCHPRQLITALDDYLKQVDYTTARQCNSSGSLCRKFDSCNAPQCPIDPRSLITPYYSGEPICLWLLEYAKEETRPDLGSAIGDIPLKVIAEVYEYLFSTYGAIRNRLNRAKLTPSRLKKQERAA